MRVDGDAAPVIAHGDCVAGLEIDFDEIGVAGDGFVHGIVEHLVDEVVHRVLVVAADIHAGAAAHRLQPLEHFDMFCRISG